VLFQVRKRELDDNLKLLEKRESYEKVVLELEKLHVELGNHNFDALLQEKERLVREVQKIEAEVHIVGVSLNCS
jgi:3-methyladenine DNA glycosylase Tag